MLSINAGSDPGYLTKEVGQGAEHYYLRSIGEAGEPPGYWLGDGLDELGLSGEVENAVFEDLFSDWIDPRKRDEMHARLEAIEAPEGSPEYAKAEKAIRAEARLGSAPRSYEKAYQKRLGAALASAVEDAPGGELTPEEVKRIELQVRTDTPSAALYYDLTFSAPKSWSVYHASLQVAAMEAREVGDLAGAEEYTRKAEQVWDAWKEGVQAGVEYMEQEAGYSRAGHHGEAVEGRATGLHVDAHEFTAAAFAQHTSRNDDPQMHVHVAVLAKVKTVDTDVVTGEERTVWRSLDGRGLFKHKQAAGHLAEMVGNEALQRTMGVRVQMRPDGKARELVGITQEQRDLHSSRRAGITDGVAQLAKAYEEREGVKPSPYVLARMSEYVTLDQRQAKKHDATTREQLLARWDKSTQQAFREGLSGIPDQVALESAVHDLHRPATEFDPQVIQMRAVAAVQEARPTWTRPDLIVELTKQLPDTLGGLDRHQVTDLLNELADEALSPAANNGVTPVKAPALVDIPAELQRRDGSFVYEPNPKTFDRYATESHLRTEERLAQFAGRRGGPAVPSELVEEVIARRGLAGRQADFVRGAATSGRAADLLVGPAGAGKSYALAALTEVWEAHEDGQVMGLASGQRAANVLRDEGITNVANIDMLLIANKSIAEGRPIEGAEKYRIPRGALVIADEAAMTSTSHLDQVRALVEASGAKLIMAGDQHQLAAVGAGGMFAQLAEDLPGVYTLDEVRRFRDIDPVTGAKVTRQWEAEASLRLREGSFEALAEYELHGRFRGGSAEEMTERAYQAWMTDHLAGKNPLLIAPDNEQAALLAARVRADLVRAKMVDEEGVTLRTGREDHGVETKAGRGDLIQLRRNNRHITAENGDFAVNRTVATVTGISDDGAMTVRLEDGALMHLPAAYVADHVELAYASTVHGAQGRTVGTTHGLVGENTSREALYVTMTRGEGGNWAYVITHREGDGIRREDVPHHLAKLNGVLQRTGMEKTATKTIEAELERREHLAVLEPAWSGVKDQHAERRFGTALLDALGPEEYRRLTSEEAYGSLMRLARQVEEAGFPAEDLLVRTARSRELDTANDHSKTLHYRLKRAWKAAEQAEVRAEQAEQRAALADQTKDVADVVEATNTRTLDPELAQQLVLAPDPAEAEQPAAEPGIAANADQEPGPDPVPEPQAQVHPHQDALLQQAMAMQTGLQVAHGGQDEEVRRRQADERDATMEALDSYAARTPELPGDLGRFMDDWAREMDARTERLGQRVAEEQPAWALDRLGPVPEDPIARADWEQRAGRVERYREAHGYHEEKSAIGQAPPAGAVEAHADWERARRALGIDQQQADISRASDERLRQIVERAEREEEWAPPYVGDSMQKAFTAERDYADQATQLEINAQTMADREAAEHEEKVTGAIYGVQTAHGYNEHQDALAQTMALQQAHTLQAEIDPSERVRETLDRAQTSRDIAETMGERAQRFREVHETREQWVDETRTVREDADLARAELDRRNPEPEPDIDAPDEPDTAAAPESAPAPQPSTEEELLQALEQARQAQQILAERAQEREQQQEPVAEAERVEESDRERRDTGYEAEYARIGQDLAGAEHTVTAEDSSPAPAAPAPEPPAPEPPDIDIEM